MNETNYHVRNNNCQEWVLIMLDKVDLLNLKNYTNIEEAQKLGMMTQIFGWAKSILSRNKDEQDTTTDEVRPDIQTLMEIVEQKGIRPLKADGVLLPASVGSMNVQKYSYIISKKCNIFKKFHYFFSFRPCFIIIVTSCLVLRYWKFDTCHFWLFIACINGKNMIF